MEQLQQLMSMMNAGCSALSWKTQDGKHLWGRNMDFNRLGQQNQLYPARHQLSYARYDNGKQPARAGAANLCLFGSRNRIFDDSLHTGAV